jgi:hypothetical protein
MQITLPITVTVTITVRVGVAIIETRIIEVSIREMETAAIMSMGLIRITVTKGVTTGTMEASRVTSHEITVVCVVLETIWPLMDALIFKIIWEKSFQF